MVWVELVEQDLQDLMETAPGMDLEVVMEMVVEMAEVMVVVMEEEEELEVLVV